MLSVKLPAPTAAATGESSSIEQRQEAEELRGENNLKAVGRLDAASALSSLTDPPGGEEKMDGGGANSSSFFVFNAASRIVKGAKSIAREAVGTAPDSPLKLYKKDERGRGTSRDFKVGGNFFVPCFVLFVCLFVVFVSTCVACESNFIPPAHHHAHASPLSRKASVYSYFLRA